jgi:SsrA-binding protein
MAQANSRPPPRIQNRKARFNYEILERIEGGLVLTGSEVKSLRAGKASIEEAFATIRADELFLRDCNISPYPMAGYAQHAPTRERKVLLHRREIRKLHAKVTQKGLTLVPLEIYFNDRGLAKVMLALVRGKVHLDKRATIREREDRRAMERAMKRR